MTRQKLNLKMLKLKKTREYLRKFSWIDAQKKALLTIETSTSVATEANAVVSSSKSSWAVIMRVQLLSLAKD